MQRQQRRRHEAVARRAARQCSCDLVERTGVEGADVRSWSMICPSLMRGAAGGGVKRQPAAGPLRAAVARLAAGLDEQRAARDHVGIGVADRARSGERMPNWTNASIASQALTPSHLQLIATAVRERRRRLKTSRILRDAVPASTISPVTAGDGADVELEVFLLVAIGRPVRARAGRVGSFFDRSRRAAGSCGAGRPGKSRRRCRRDRTDGTRRTRPSRCSTCGRRSAAAGCDADRTRRSTCCRAPCRSWIVSRASARRGQRRRGQRRDDLLGRRGQVDHGDVARDVVHDVGARVVRVDDDAARILAGRDLQHARRDRTDRSAPWPRPSPD